MRRSKLLTIKGSSAPGRRRRRIFDCQGIFHYEFILGGKTAKKKDVYTYILRRFMDSFRRKLSVKWKNNNWFLLHDNAPAHRSVLGMDFLAKNNVTTLEHPLHSPDLATAEFYLFPRHKSALKGRRFCDATDIIKNAKDELKRLSQYGFQECFQQFYRRW